MDFDLAQDQVGGAEQGVDRPAVGPDDRFGQRVEGAKEHRGRVDGEQRLGLTPSAYGPVGYGLGDGRDTGPRIAPGNRQQLGWLNFGDRQAGRARHSAASRPISSPRSAATAGSSGAGSGSPAALMPGGKLPRDETELVILRVAHNTGSEYEWSHHERIGQRAGLTDEEIARVRDRRRRAGWSARRALLLRAADEMHDDGARSATSSGPSCAAELDEVLLIELCMLIGHYEMLAMTLNTLGVEPERRRAAPMKRGGSRDLAGKRCLITGAASGIGRATAIAVAAQGRRALPHRRRRRGAGGGRRRDPRRRGGPATPARPTSPTTRRSSPWPRRSTPRTAAWTS